MPLITDLPARLKPAAGRPPPIGRRRALRAVGRHKVRSALAAIIVLLTPVFWSLGSALLDPGLGSSVAARLAEWMRDHGGGSIVVKAENIWYSHHPPPIGGRPAKGAVPAASPSALTTASSRSGHLPVPAAITPLATPAFAGEGRWQPVGRSVDGLSAMYDAFLRPDAVHTSVVVGVAWMDTTLLSAQQYGGSTIPGGGPWKYTAPVSNSASRTLVAAFNAGFLMKDARGGYYLQGTTVDPLRTGAASLVIYRNGNATVGQWGRDVTMTSKVVSVRQNLDLLVDQGKPVPGLQNASSGKWGYTLGNSVYVWRSGLGVTADGALVYVAGPDLDITDLAQVLVRAGAVRAMELDINTDWVNLATFAPAPGASASPTNGKDLLPGMSGSSARYFASWWSRDFVTMSARAPASSSGH